MIRKSFLLFIFSLILISTSAQNIDSLEARNIAVNFFGSHINQKQLECSEVIKHNNNTLFYVFQYEKSFVLLSGNKNMIPIPAWSDNGIWSNGKEYSYNYFLERYIKEAVFIIENNIQADKQISLLWDEIYSIKISNYNSKSISPLLSTQWDQNCYYNDSCPISPSAPSYLCGHVPSGCAATSMAQIMNYFQYPQSGSGSNSYYHVNYGNQNVDFSTAIYNYVLMPNVLNSSNSELAKLMYHAGVAVNMNYGVYASGTANLNVVRDAMVNNFNYMSSASVVSKDDSSTSFWIALMKNELDAGRPIMYSGLDTNIGGHAFVCDAYQTNDYFHINWGWSGFYDGYYQLDLLNPNTADYSNYETAIIDLKPYNPGLLAHFSANKTIIQAGDNIDFNDFSTGSPVSWDWKFIGANSSSSSIQNPTSIVYNIPGIYDVQLIIGDLSNYDTLVLRDYIKVLPEACFTANKTIARVGENINFTDLSISLNNITSWNWTFTGASTLTSTQQNPNNISWQVKGIYNVSLTVSDGVSSNTITKNNYISIYDVSDTLYYREFDKEYINSYDLVLFTRDSIDLDGYIPYYAGAGHNSNWMIFNEPDGASLNYFYGITSWFNPPNTADNWYIFGPITVPQRGSILSWKHKYYDLYHNKRDGYEVLLSTNGSSFSDFDTSLYVVYDNSMLTQGDSLWTDNTIYLELSNQTIDTTIWIAFHHFANNMSYLFIDDIFLIDYQLPGVGIDNFREKDDMIVLYPNPSEGIITFKHSNNSKAELKIYDSKGQLVYKNSIFTNTEVDLNNLERGIYLYNLSVDNNNSNGKFILLR